MSGLINFNFKLRGCQISCCGNYSIIGTGCQIGWSNIAEQMKGAQFGGCLSAANDIEGLQLAAFNWGGCCRGVQIGAINQCEKLEGLQVVSSIMPMPRPGARSAFSMSFRHPQFLFFRSLTCISRRSFSLQFNRAPQRVIYKERLYVSSNLQRRFKRRWWRLSEMS